MKTELNEFLRRATLRPSISFVEAINADRLLKKNHIDTTATFSKYGFSETCNLSGVSISKALPKKKNSLKTLEDQTFNSRDMVVKAFQELEGEEIDTLNLLYANFFIDNNDFTAWNYFFNKYLLAKNGWKIHLKSFTFDNLFDVMESKSLNEEQEVQQNRPLVSVIMPSYNNEDTISYAINSILNQTYSNIELIVVDDCSSDNTQNVCLELVKNDTRIRYIKNKKNSGAYISRNNGLKIARGAYVTILDADDFSFSERIAYQVNRLLESKAKVHLGYYLRLDEKGHIVAFRQTGKFSFDGALHKCLASMLIEKKFFDDALGYWDSVRFGADSELYYRILRMGEELIIEDTVPVYLALDKQNSLTNTKASKIGGTLRQQYAENFLRFHETVGSNALYYPYPQRKRPFLIPKEMEIDITSNNIALSDLPVDTINLLDELSRLKNINMSRFDYVTPYFNYQCLWQNNHQSKYLFVFFHVAQDRTKKEAPFFERWSWTDVVNGSILNISDPTLLLDDNLRVGWYVGNISEYPAKIITSFVHKVAEINSIDPHHIIFYGSSGAGFTALACSRYLKNSNAVAINAQTNALKYYQGHVRDMLQSCFGTMEEDRVYAQYKERLDMTYWYGNETYTNNILLVQNDKDAFHLKNHYLPFVEATNLTNNHTVLYSHENGHGPEPKDMVPNILNKLLKNKLIKDIFLLGTCRLHRLFIKNNKGEIINNTDEHINVIYPKLGFFHTISEIVQIIEWIQGETIIAAAASKYVFRKENPETMPLNAFDVDLEYRIENNIMPNAPVVDFEKIDHFVFEVCSVKSYYDTGSHLYFHTNPNFLGKFDYRDMPKEGIYGVDALNMPSVECRIETEDSMRDSFSKLFEYMSPAKVTIMGHLIDPSNPNETRKKLNTVLEKLSHEFNFNYIDTGVFVGQYGFNVVDDTVDIHHLTHEGEMELGKTIQKYILNNS